MPDETRPDRLTFYFEKDKDYRLYPANGFWGGVTPRGDFKVEFFVESANTPDSVTNVVTNGMVGLEDSRSPSFRIVRTLECGVLMSLDQAESFAKFMLDAIKKYQLLREVKENPNAGPATQH